MPCQNTVKVKKYNCNSGKKKKILLLIKDCLVCVNPKMLKYFCLCLFFLYKCYYTHQIYQYLIRLMEIDDVRATVTHINCAVTFVYFVLRIVYLHFITSISVITEKSF